MHEFSNLRKNSPALIAIEGIASRILILRDQRVILDADLATLYGVETRRLNEQVRRNTERFPGDFVFPVSTAEFANLKSQCATSSWGGRRKLPLAFTEHGAVMVLQSPRATEVSVYVVRAFVQLHDTLFAHKDLALRLDQLESRIERGKRLCQLILQDHARCAVPGGAQTCLVDIARPGDPDCIMAVKNPIK